MSSFKKLGWVYCRATLIMIAMTLCLWLGLKISFSLTAQPYYTDWSDNGKCYLNHYSADYRRTAMGSLLGIFNSHYFFRGFKKDGSFIKSSEWSTEMFTQDSDYLPRWEGSSVVFEYDDFDSWYLEECT